MKKNPCPICGTSKDSRFKYCYKCAGMKQSEAMQKANYENDDPLRELPEDEFCVMCGREWGTDLRKDGKYYCSTCWMVWTS